MPIILHHLPLSISHLPPSLPLQTLSLSKSKTKKKKKKSSFMGASFAKHSNLPSSPSSSDSSSLEDIPENCISIVFMYLDPPEICNLASLNRAFRAASSADFVWESKLPSNYNFLLHRVLHPQLCQPKKHIFATLTRPYLFDHATKEVWLDKSSGKIFVSISSKALKITGIDDRRYWNYIPTDESSQYRLWRTDGLCGQLWSIVKGAIYHSHTNVNLSGNHLCTIHVDATCISMETPLVGFGGIIWSSSTSILASLHGPMCARPLLFVRTFAWWKD